MRRVFVGLGICLVLIAPACRADATVIYGTAGGGAPVAGRNLDPWLNVGMSCSPTVADLNAEIDRGLPVRGGQVPRTPVPGLTPEAGSRYLQYDGNGTYGRGLLVQFGYGDVPSSVSMRAAAPTGHSFAIPVVIAVTDDPSRATDGSVMEYLGVANRAHWQSIGPTWTTASIDLVSTNVFTWFPWSNQTSSFQQSAGQWSGGHDVMGVRPTWWYRVGFLFGCGDSAPVDVDQLTTTSSKSGPRSFDFEGLAASVTATPSAATVTYGKAVTISATAMQGATRAAVPLRLVRCQGVTCQYLGDPVTSSPSGPVSFTVHPEPGWSYGVRYDGDATFDPAQGEAAIGVRSKLVVGLSQKRAHAGDTVGIGGQIGPCTGSPRKLAIQRLVHGRWRTIGHAHAARCAVVGRHQFKPVHGAVRLGAVGTWKLRVVAPAAAGSVTTVSRTLRVAVTRAPVRHVTSVHYAPPPVTHTDHTTTTAPPPPPT